MVLDRQCALLAQHLPEGFVLVENPGVHRRDQLVARDEVHLQGDDAEEQVAVGIVGVSTRRHGGGSQGKDAERVILV